MRPLARGLLILFALLVALLGTILLAVGSPQPRITEPRDLFGFADRETAAVSESLPDLKFFNARDHTKLAYRFYDSSADRILIFLHGSSYHGAAYHALALHLSQQDIAKVVTPNLRGHFMSGSRRGDVDYIGQLEHDIEDLIESLRSEGLRGPITIGGHSSGGGLVIRFAGGDSQAGASSYLLLSPLIPTSPSVKGRVGIIRPIS
jgi:alpha-beta hydrolase superfamily lysophospholipase